MLHVLELTAPGDVIARRELNLVGHRLACPGDVAADVAVADVDVDVRREQAVLGADALRALGDDDLGELAERDHPTVHHRHQYLACDLLRVGTHFARVAHGDTVAFATFDGGGHHLAAERRADHVLQLADRQAVARQLLAVRFDVQVEAAGDALGESAGRSRHGLDHRFDLLGQFLHLVETLAEHLDADRRADAGGQHVDARLDRHRPGVGDAGDLQRLVEFGGQLVDGHAGAPLGLRLQVDHRLEHLHRRRVGRRVGAAGLAIDRFDFREALDDLVLRLHQLGRLGDRHARQRSRHVEQRALVQRRHELGTEF